MRGDQGPSWGSLVSTAIVSSVLVFAGTAAHADIIRYDPFKPADPSPILSSEPTPVVVTQPAALPSLLDLKMIDGSFETPILWGIQMTGADLIREDLASVHVPAAEVVVSDCGVKVGASRVSFVPGEPRKRRMISLKITPLVGEGKVVDWMGKAIDYWNGIVPTEVPDPEDPTVPEDSFHGTHVAGVIGALNPEFGVSPFSRVTDMNIFKGMNLYEPANLIAGLNELQKSSDRVDVINMSHYVDTSDEFKKVVKGLRSKFDTMIVVAAGNDGAYLSSKSSLAKMPELTVVGALNPSGALANFSNFGAPVDIVAPGDEILSRGGQMDYGSEKLEMMSGTSMAAPFVSGTLASLRALLPQARSADLYRILFTSAIDLGEKGKDPVYGHGFLNTFKAMNVALRLQRLNLSSAKAIAQAVQVQDTFTFTELKNKFVMDRTKASEGSKKYEGLMRRLALLDGSPKALKSLGDHYLKMGLLRYGMGWKLASVNSTSSAADVSEAKEVATTAWGLIAARAVEKGDASSILKTLANVDLTLELYHSMPDQLLSTLTPFFTRKVAVLDSSRLSDLQTLIAERTPTGTSPTMVAQNLN